MRCELLHKVAFTDAGTGAIASVKLADVEQVAFVVDVTNVTGAPTLFRFHAYQYELAAAVAPFGVRRSFDLTSTGVAYLGQRTSVQIEPAFENDSSSVLVTLFISGGVSPKVSGNLYVFGKRR